MDAAEYGAVRHSKIHPRFLNTNSTSHKWAFGAIAELLDNAADASASQAIMEMRVFEVPGGSDGSGTEPLEALIIMDNGTGVDREQMHRLLSFGHSEKAALLLAQQNGERDVAADHKPIGRYGNGFKSSSMRLGRDALVLSKTKEFCTVGLLSQSFLESVDADDVLVPIVSWRHGKDERGEDTYELLPDIKDGEAEQSLAIISKHSIFSSAEEIMGQFMPIGDTGTLIIMTRLRGFDTGALELDYRSTPEDIVLHDPTAEDGVFQKERHNQRAGSKIKLDYSLRAYLTYLYKVPRMQIYLQGAKVKTRRMTGMLSSRHIETYKPNFVAEPATIQIGFSESQHEYGMMIYHRNRLIKPYVRVGIQNDPDERGMGVLGIVEADFLQPTHNKQDFDDSRTHYRTLLKKCAETLKSFWWDNVERGEAEAAEEEAAGALFSGQRRTRKRKAPMMDRWIQCDFPECLKWRKVPANYDLEPYKDGTTPWYCQYHPDPAWANHDVPEEQEVVEPTLEELAEAKELKREYDAQVKATRALKRQKDAEEKRRKAEEEERARKELEKQRKALEETLKEIEEQRARLAAEAAARRAEEASKAAEAERLAEEAAARRAEEALKATEAQRAAKTAAAAAEAADKGTGDARAAEAEGNAAATIENAPARASGASPTPSTPSPTSAVASEQDGGSEQSSMATEESDDHFMVTPGAPVANADAPVTEGREAEPRGQNMPQTISADQAPADRVAGPEDASAGDSEQARTAQAVAVEAAVAVAAQAAAAKVAAAVAQVAAAKVVGLSNVPAPVVAPMGVLTRGTNGSIAAPSSAPDGTVDADGVGAAWAAKLRTALVALAQATSLGDERVECVRGLSDGQLSQLDIDRLCVDALAYQRRAATSRGADGT